MTETMLTTTVHRATPGVTVIELAGDVTPAVEQELMAAYDEAGDDDSVVLDFGGLEYMNSGGIGLLVTLLVRAQRAGQQLLAHGLSDHYRQIFSLTRLDDAIELHPDRDTAVEAAQADQGQGNS